MLVFRFFTCNRQPHQFRYVATSCSGSTAGCRQTILRSSISTVARLGQAKSVWSIWLSHATKQTRQPEQTT